MARPTALLLLALGSLVPSAFSIPVLAQEDCVCQPLEGQTFSNSSLASCNKIAADIQQWRAVSFHSPYLADAFVDSQQALQVSREGRPMEKVQSPRKSGCHERMRPESAFDKAVRKLFRQWKEPSTLKEPSKDHVLNPTRPTWPWEQSGNEERSTGSEVERKSQPAFLKPAQRYRILCRSRNTPNEYSSRPELVMLAGLIIVVICMTLFDMVLVGCRGYKWATQPSPVTLAGDEKQTYAYDTDEKSFDDAVVPAISDL